MRLYYYYRRQLIKIKLGLASLCAVPMIGRQCGLSTNKLAVRIETKPKRCNLTIFFTGVFRLLKEQTRNRNYCRRCLRVDVEDVVWRFRRVLGSFVVLCGLFVDLCAVRCFFNRACANAGSQCEHVN